ncbi:hypothetical protein HU200_066996 [Digitaria exilis]|uniref:Uncharacterized protein n=1 Tax=Digitaria exilis TaxID=1010633 RepID=A0A835A0X4_9POAL|nr:hypothetical protein HU200_066996 [Digitaria exilis]
MELVLEFIVWMIRNLRQ